MKPYARIAGRSDPPKDPNKGTLILGISFGDVFKPGHLYEIIEIMGEHIIRDLGESAASPQKHPQGVTWNRDANSLINHGGHLFTVEEYRWKCIQHLQCKNCRHPGSDHVFPGLRCLFGTMTFEETQEEERP